jgi:hypothetical protein
MRPVASWQAACRRNPPSCRRRISSSSTMAGRCASGALPSAKPARWHLDAPMPRHLPIAASLPDHIPHGSQSLPALRQGPVMQCMYDTV